MQECQKQYGIGITTGIQLFGIGIPALPSYGHFAVCAKVLYFEIPWFIYFLNLVKFDDVAASGIFRSQPPPTQRNLRGGR
jgi:hypothetical protein